MNQPKVYSSGCTATGFTNEYGQSIFMDVATKGGGRMSMLMERDEEPVFDLILSDQEAYQLRNSLNGLFFMVKEPNNNNMNNDLDPPVIRFYRTQIADGKDLHPGMVQHAHGIYVQYTDWLSVKNAYAGAQEEIAILKMKLAQASKPAYISPEDDRCPQCNSRVVSYTKNIGCTDRTCLMGHRWVRESNESIPK